MIEENDEIKKLTEELTSFVSPKFKELQKKLSGEEKPNFFKMMKIAKEFSENLKKEYKEKYDRDLEKDILKVNQNIGFDMDMLKNMDLSIFKK